MRPVFCGNFDFDARQSDLERLFSKHGPIRRIDMKSGYAFIYFEDERDAEDAIRRLDSADFGHSRRRLSVQWSRQEEPVSKNRDRPAGDAKPTRTLFVINFDQLRTKIRDIEKHFEPYGKISNIRIRKNFAFVRYETVEEASAAVKKTDKSTILDRVVTVEFAFRDDDNERDDRYDIPKQGNDRYGSPKRGNDRYGSPRRGDDRYASPKRADQGRRRDGPYVRSPSPRLMKVQGVKPNPITYCSLVNGYSKAGLLHMVPAIIRQTENTDVVLDTPFFNCVISAYAKSGDIKIMEEMLQLMKDNKCKPGKVVYTTIIQAYSAHGMDEAAKLLETELERFG